MNKWLKKITPSARNLENSLENSKEFKELKPLFHSSCFWSREQQAVARGVAAGLAGCVIPGFQIIYAAILVFILRGNLPVALLCTLVSNPLTVAPISYFIYLVGTLIISNGHNRFEFQAFKWDFSSAHIFWSNVSEWALQFGKAYLVGLRIVSVCLGFVGYFGTILIWEVSLLFFPKMKK